MRALPWQALVVLLCLSSCRPAPDPAPRRDAMPVDVASFIARQDACEALRRYTPRDGDDMHDLARDRSQMCDDLEVDLVELRRSYRNDGRIIRVLHERP